MRSVALRIEGMHCSGCASTLTQVLKRAPGVRTAAVSYEQGAARLVIDPQRTSPAALAAVIADAGFAAEQQETPQNGHGNG